jgi:hypothetical protein
MKKKSLTLCLLAATFLAQSQNVGIGTITPLARLHVKDSSVLFVASGDVPVVKGNPPVSGEGRRMMWYPDKAAFRAGYVNFSNWDKANIGDYSVALGYNNNASGYSSFAAGTTNTASGNTSTALGFQTISSGIYSTTMGQFTNASGTASTALGFQTAATSTYSTAMGYNTTASGLATTTMGYSTTASGIYSVAMGYGTTTFGPYSATMGYNTIAYGYISSAMGYGTTATSFGEMAIGTYNTDYTPNSTSSWNAADRLFVVGNGVDAGSKNNAIVVLKNGNTGLGINNPSATLEVARGSGFMGAAAFHGTSHISHFYYGTDEDTYIRAGKDNRYVILNDIPGGKVGIGITTPNAPLAFTNNTGQKISLYESSPNSQYGFAVQPGQLQLYTDASAGKISFGYYSSGIYTERMYLNNSTGNLIVNGINYPSDARLKDDISPLQNSLERIIQLNGYTYHWKNEQSGNGLQTGVLAQEVQKLLPQLVIEDNKGMLSVNYSGLIPVLIESIKEQQKQINELVKHDKVQEQQINELKKMLEKLLK